MKVFTKDLEKLTKKLKEDLTALDKWLYAERPYEEYDKGLQKQNALQALLQKIEVIQTGSTKTKITADHFSQKKYELENLKLQNDYLKASHTELKLDVRYSVLMFDAMIAKDGPTLGRLSIDYIKGTGFVAPPKLMEKFGQMFFLAKDVPNEFPKKQNGSYLQKLSKEEADYLGVSHEKKEVKKEQPIEEKSEENKKKQPKIETSSTAQDKSNQEKGEKITIIQDKYIKYRAKDVTKHYTSETCYDYRPFDQVFDKQALDHIGGEITTLQDFPRNHRGRPKLNKTQDKMAVMWGQQSMRKVRTGYNMNIFGIKPLEKINFTLAWPNMNIKKQVVRISLSPSSEVKPVFSKDIQSQINPKAFHFVIDDNPDNVDVLIGSAIGGSFELVEPLTKEMKAYAFGTRTVLYSYDGDRIAFRSNGAVKRGRLFTVYTLNEDMNILQQFNFGYHGNDNQDVDKKQSKTAMKEPVSKVVVTKTKKSKAIDENKNAKETQKPVEHVKNVTENVDAKVTKKPAEHAKDSKEGILEFKEGYGVIIKKLPHVKHRAYVMMHMFKGTEEMSKGVSLSKAFGSDMNDHLGGKIASFNDNRDHLSKHYVSVDRSDDKVEFHGPYENGTEKGYHKTFKGVKGFKDKIFGGENRSMLHTLYAWPDLGPNKRSKLNVEIETASTSLKPFFNKMEAGFYGRGIKYFVIADKPGGIDVFYKNTPHHVEAIEPHQKSWKGVFGTRAIPADQIGNLVYGSKKQLSSSDQLATIYALDKNLTIRREIAIYQKPNSSDH